MNPYASHKLWVTEPTSLPTKDGSLRLTPHQFIPYSFSFFIAEKGPETDMIGSTVKLIDSDGIVWCQGHSVWGVDDFIDPIGSLGSLSWPVSADVAPEGFTNPFMDGLWLTGTQGLMDDRFYHHLVIGATVYTVPMKYQGPLLDLAFSADTPMEMAKVYARVSQLYGLVSPSEEHLTIPPFIVEVAVFDRLFLNYYAKESEDYWERDTIPKIITFESTGETGDKNSLISHVQS